MQIIFLKLANILTEANLIHIMQFAVAQKGSCEIPL